MVIFVVIVVNMVNKVSMVMAFVIIYYGYFYDIFE
jgi:hypothetical protein